MIVIVTGSRTFHDVKAIWADLDDKKAEGMRYLLHGGADGADRIAQNWAESRGFPGLAINAPWTGRKRAAGPIRNGWLAQAAIDLEQPDEGGVVVLAYPNLDSKGTFDMMRISRELGFTVLNRTGVPV